MRVFAPQSADQHTSPKHHAGPSVVRPTPIAFPSITDGVLQRKSGCACGGGCPSCAEEEAGHAIQTKLTVSSPGDHYEQEADRIAAQIVRIPESTFEVEHLGVAENQIQRLPLPFKPSQTSEPGQLDSGGGRPLSRATRRFMEPRFGADFREVRVHDDSPSRRKASQFNARAFTINNHIWLGPGECEQDANLIAHELTHVVQQGAAELTTIDSFTEHRGLNVTSTPAEVLQRRVLTTPEQTAAIASNRAFFDSLSVRVLQTITGVPAADRDGAIGGQTVRAISDWQTARGLTDDGIVDQASMDRLVTDSLATSRPEHGIQLVLDYYSLITSGDTLTVRRRTGASTIEGFNFVGVFPVPIISPASTTFEEGNLRVIEVDDAAFASATLLRDTIHRELGRAAPVVAPVGPTPTRLTVAQERAAVLFNRSKYSDEQSVRAIQGLVGAPVTGLIDATTVEFIAEAQDAAGLTVDGQVGIGTTESFYTQMIARNNPNSGLRLLVDFFDMRDDGNLLTVFFDPTVTALASTDFRPSEPVRVRIGPDALTLPFSGAVHNIAHELEHVRRLRQGIVSAATHEFLGEALEVLSVGMPEEPLDPVNPTHDAFINDATRCLDNWNLMPIADQRTFRNRFIAVRRKVLQRIDAGTPPQRAANAALRANYVAVVLP